MHCNHKRTVTSHTVTSHSVTSHTVTTNNNNSNLPLKQIILILKLEFDVQMTVHRDKFL